MNALRGGIAELAFALSQRRLALSQELEIAARGSNCSLPTYRQLVTGCNSHFSSKVISFAPVYSIPTRSPNPNANPKLNFITALKPRSSKSTNDAKASCRVMHCHHCSRHSKFRSAVWWYAEQQSVIGCDCFLTAR